MNVSKLSSICKAHITILRRGIHDLKKIQVGVLGVPFAKGQNKSGVALGPNALRKAGLFEQMKHFNEWIDIYDYGNVSIEQSIPLTIVPKNMKNYQDVVSVMKEVSLRTKEILQDQRFCLTLGGDHSVAFGSVDGHLKHNKDIAVVWIDAHADLNTNRSSVTGHIHGMPVAILGKELQSFFEHLPGLEYFEDAIPLKNFVYIGLRAVEPLERYFATKFHMHFYGMDAIDKYGIVQVTEMALKDVDPNGTKKIHISFDIDSLDPLEAPSTGTPERGGMTLREGCYVVEEIFKTGRLSAMDLVEVNPEIGSLTDVEKTINAAIQIIKASCGRERSGNLPLDAHNKF